MIQRPLTDKQRRVLEWVREFTVEQGMPPSAREVAQGLGYCQTSVKQYYATLRKKGWVRLYPGTARGIVVLAEQPRQGQE